MAPEAFLERCVVLRAAKNIGHELTEDRAAAEELDHARGNGSSEEGTAIEAADDARSEGEFGSEGGADPVGVNLRLALGQCFAEQFAGAHCVKKTLASERVNPCGCVANERPILANNGALRERAFLRRRQNVRVELADFGRYVLFLNECLQMRAQLPAGMRSHAATDADG